MVNLSPHSICASGLDRTSPTPLFQQILENIENAIERGDLAAGERLPPVRALAAQLDVNTLTVSRAYKELTSRGRISGRGPLGTFVTTPPEHESGASPKKGKPNFLTWKSRYPEDTFRQTLEATGFPGSISLTQAYPTAAAIDLKPFEAALAETIARDKDAIYRYQAPDGSPALKDALRDTLLNGSPGLDGPLIITSGGQQAIALVMRVILRAGDTVLFERPSYFGALDVARSIGARCVGVDLEEDGPSIEQMERAIQAHKPKLIFLMPDFQNPTGKTTSLVKRRAIVDLVENYGVAVLEDDHAPEMRFRGEHLPSIKSLADPEAPIFYARGFGKSFVPGVRLGMLLSPPSHYQFLASQKSMGDLHTSWLLQNAFARYLLTPGAMDNVKRQRLAYAKVQEAVYERTLSILPEGSKVTLPDGGFNMWVEFPEHIDSIDLCWACAERGVTLLVGAPLFPDRENLQTVRLSYGLGDLERLQEGIRRLGAAIREVSPVAGLLRK